MILKLVVPPGDAAFRSGYVATWHKREGEPVAFGDDLCDIAIDHFMALQRTKRAALLGTTKRRRRLRSAYDRREGRGVVHMRLTSADGGLTVGRIVVPEGGRVDIGDVVGVLHDGEGPVPTEETVLTAAPDARIAVNMPDAAELDPFD